MSAHETQESKGSLPAREEGWGLVITSIVLTGLAIPLLLAPGKASSPRLGAPYFDAGTAAANTFGAAIFFMGLVLASFIVNLVALATARGKPKQVAGVWAGVQFLVAVAFCAGAGS